MTVYAPTPAGDKALVCRYIRRQNPPYAELRLSEKTDEASTASNMRALLRYVSLIPYLDDAATGARLDVWNTADSFLDLNAGDAEEHATLLCNLFLGLGRKDAHVVLGRELPEGDVAYVLTLRPVRLWNAHTGRCYTRDDPKSPLSACPLSHVGVVFNDRNVWANRQLADRPREMQWNLEDPACWKKLFDGAAKRSADSLPAFTETEWATKPGLAPLQRKGLTYHRMHDEYRADLEAEIEERLKEELQDLRGARPTDWNISVGKTLKELLVRFEEDASGGVKLSQDYHDQTLDKVSKSMHLVGLPLHHALVATPPPVGAAQADLVEGPVLKPLLLKLRHSNVWRAESAKIKFALSCYVHPYPNHLASVWVYVAALHDDKFAAVGP